MIGSLKPHTKNVTIIGAGISGLLIADRLIQLGYSVTLFEKNPRPGGLVSTHETPFGISESAAHTLLGSEPVLNLFKSLDLDYVESHSKQKYIYKKGRLRKFPLSFTGTLSLIFRLLFRINLKQNANCTVSQWSDDYLGKQATQYLIDPMVTGIYGCTPQELDAQTAFSKFIPSPFQSLFIKQLFSKKRKKAKMIALTSGTEALVLALEKRIKDKIKNRYHLGTEITDLKPFLEDNLILTVPPKEASELLKDHLPFLSQKLSQIKTAPLISVTAFVKDDQNVIPDGIGVLYPSVEKRKVLGILFNSKAYPNRSPDPKLTSLSFILGGTKNPELLALSELEIKDLITQEMTQSFHSSLPIVYFKCFKWNRAIPLYDLHLKSALEQAKADLNQNQGLILFGNYTGEVSIRGMIETVSSFC